MIIGKQYRFNESVSGKQYQLHNLTAVYKHRMAKTKTQHTRAEGTSKGMKRAIAVPFQQLAHKMPRLAAKFAISTEGPSEVTNSVTIIDDHG